MNMELAAIRVMERCDTLATCGEEPDRLTRRFATAPMREVNEVVGTWMRAAGMTVRQDPIGNLVGRYEARMEGAKTLLLGSHLDTVRDAGKYDGPLGVLVALACIERLHQRHERLPFALELYGFADEEGLRYHTSYLGSRAVAGTLPHNVLETPDRDGITVADAIRAFGGEPDALGQAKRSSEDVLGYCEVHIEQGPVLESLGLPVGIVSSIAGQSRIDLVFTGQAGHAGTVPMSMRRDALCAASAFVLAVEEIGRSTPGLVTTVGQMDVQPGASNVIPGRVRLSLDVRHQEDAVRRDACQRLHARASAIRDERHVMLEWRSIQDNATVSCGPRLSHLFEQAVREEGYPVHILASGAGHDGVALSALTDIAMLFVRCKGGISHNPAEAVTTEDVAAAIHVLERLLYLLAGEQEGAENP